MNTYCFRFYYADSEEYDYKYVKFFRTKTLNNRIFKKYRSFMRENFYASMIILKNNEYITTYSEPSKVDK